MKNCHLWSNIVSRFSSLFFFNRFSIPEPHFGNIRANVASMLGLYFENVRAQTFTFIEYAYSKSQIRMSYIRRTSRFKKLTTIFHTELCPRNARDKSIPTHYRALLCFEIVS